jgi:hypothetical protein
MLTPIAHGLKTLEGQNTTCSDVLNIYIGIAIGYNVVFRDACKSTANGVVAMEIVMCMTDYLIQPVPYTSGDHRHFQSTIVVSIIL